MVQSDKTLLLEVDHPDADACRMAIAPFAELERAPEHIHTYRLTPLGLWNARAAGHDAEQVVDTLLTYSRYPVPSSLLVDVADTMDRFGRLRLEKHPLHGLVLVSTDRAVLTEVLRSREGQGAGRRPAGRRHGGGAPVRARSPQAGAAQARLAGRGPGRLRQRRGARDRSGAERLGAAAVPAAGRRFLLARRIRRGRAALRGRQDRGRGGLDGARPGHHVDLGHQHRVGPPVARRAAAPDHPDRRRDRRVLRRPEADPAGDHRDVPGDHHQARRRSTRTWSCSAPATGVW